MCINDGDVIVFCNPNNLYRNDGKYMWFNHRVIALSYECDEYGEVPPRVEIKPGAFNPRYWDHTIAHNINYWPCDNYRTQCCNNMTVSNKISRIRVPNCTISFEKIPCMHGTMM